MTPVLSSTHVSNNAILFIWLFFHLCIIGVSLISLQQHCYENANVRAALDNAQPMTRLGIVCAVG